MQLVNEARCTKEHTAIDIDTLIVGIDERGMNVFGGNAAHVADRCVTMHYLTTAEKGQKTAGELFTIGHMHKGATTGKIFEVLFPFQGIAMCEQFQEGC